MFSGGGWKKAAAITIIAFSLSQALSIDLLMMNDSRYYAESWFTENVDRDAEIEFYFVNKGKLPRLEALGYTNLVAVSPDPGNLSRLSERDPDYIIVTFRSVALQEDLERYYDSLLSGSMGYVPVAHFRTEVQFLLQEPINYVNPEITVLKRL
jgi:hypothetical protein